MAAVSQFPVLQPLLIREGRDDVFIGGNCNISSVANEPASTFTRMVVPLSTPGRASRSPPHPPVKSVGFYPSLFISWVVIGGLLGCLLHAGKVNIVSSSLNVHPFIVEQLRNQGGCVQHMCGHSNTSVVSFPEIDSGGHKDEPFRYFDGSFNDSSGGNLSERDLGNCETLHRNNSTQPILEIEGQSTVISRFKLGIPFFRSAISNSGKWNNLGSFLGMELLNNQILAFCSGMTDHEHWDFKSVRSHQSSLGDIDWDKSVVSNFHLYKASATCPWSAPRTRLHISSLQDAIITAPVCAAVSSADVEFAVAELVLTHAHLRGVFFGLLNRSCKSVKECRTISTLLSEYAELEDLGLHLRVELQAEKATGMLLSSKNHKSRVESSGSSERRRQFILRVDHWVQNLSSRYGLIFFALPHNRMVGSTADPLNNNGGRDLREPFESVSSGEKVKVAGDPTITVNGSSITKNDDLAALEGGYQLEDVWFATAEGEFSSPLRHLQHLGPTWSSISHGWIRRVVVGVPTSQANHDATRRFVATCRQSLGFITPNYYGYGFVKRVLSSTWLYLLLLLPWGAHSILSPQPLTLIHIPRLAAYVVVVAYRRIVLHSLGKIVEASLTTAHDYSDHAVLFVMSALVLAFECTAAERSHYLVPRDESRHLCFLLAIVPSKFHHCPWLTVVCNKIAPAVASTTAPTMATMPPSNGRLVGLATPSENASNPGRFGAKSCSPLVGVTRTIGPVVAATNGQEVAKNSDDFIWTWSFAVQVVRLYCCTLVAAVSYSMFFTTVFFHHRAEVLVALLVSIVGFLAPLWLLTTCGFISLNWLGIQWCRGGHNNN